MSAVQRTTIDWMRFRTRSDPPVGLNALRGLYGELGASLSLKHLDRGSDGFRSAAAVTLGGMAVGRVDYGGESQRGWCRWNLTGQGCEWVKDWDAIDALESLPASELRRADIALTTWSGEVGHDDVVAAHSVGRFSCGGRPPNLRQITNSDPRAGRTCYVGQRDADKFLRTYEKGLELAAKCPPSMHVTQIDGHAVEDIYRCEIELKAQTRPVPWEVVVRRDQYFAGSYPFCADVLPGVEPDILMRRPDRAPQTSLVVALENIRIQYGNVLFTALVAYDGSMTDVWNRVVGNGHNEALVEAGVLLVNHP